MSEKVKKVLSVTASVILWAVIFLAAAFSFVTLATSDPNNVSSFLGYTPMSVQTDSMSPTFNAGDLIIVKKCDPKTLEVGDIITFHTIIENNFALNTHRIQEIEDHGSYRFYTTKGDNNIIADKDMISDSDIVGKYVCRIPFLGKVMNFLQSKVGFFVCILLPMLGFFVYQIYNLIMIAMKYKRASALEAAEEAARVQARVQAENAASGNNEEFERMKRELEETRRKLAEADKETEPEPQPQPVEEEKVTESQKPQPVEEKVTESQKPQPAVENVVKQQPVVENEVKQQPAEVNNETETRQQKADDDQKRLEALKARRAQLLAEKKAREESLAEKKADMGVTESKEQ